MGHLPSPVSTDSVYTDLRLQALNVNIIDSPDGRSTHQSSCLLEHQGQRCVCTVKAKRQAGVTETAVRHLLMNTHIQVLYVNGTIPHLAMLLFYDIPSRCYPWEEATFLQEGILGREHQ